MALTDDQKLNLVRTALDGWLNSFQDWPSFKTALQGITKAQLKSFILNVLQSASDNDSVTSAELLLAQQDKLGLHTEISNDM